MALALQLDTPLWKPKKTFRSVTDILRDIRNLGTRKHYSHVNGGDLTVQEISDMLSSEGRADFVLTAEESFPQTLKNMQEEMKEIKWTLKIFWCVHLHMPQCYPAPPQRNNYTMQIRSESPRTFPMLSGSSAIVLLGKRKS